MGESIWFDCGRGNVRIGKKGEKKSVRLRLGLSEGYADEGIGGKGTDWGRRADEGRLFY